MEAAEIISTMSTKDLLKMYTELVIELSYDAPRTVLPQNIEEAKRQNFLLLYTELVNRLNK